MQKTATWLLLLVLGALLLGGCGSSASLMSPQERQAPLTLSYDIQYVDESAVGIELMILAPDAAQQATVLTRDMDRVIDRVASAVPKSAILARQSEFRQTLASAFKASSELGREAHLVLLQVYEMRAGELSGLAMR